MAENRNGPPEFEWPAELAEYDEAVFGSKSRWHLRRCYALPRRMKRAKMDEIRLSMGRDPI